MSSSKTYTGLVKLVFVAVLITMIGCSMSSGPSDSSIKSAVKASVEASAPSEITRRISTCRGGNVSRVTINSKGKPQDDENITYYPVKALIQGSCDPKMFGDKYEYEGEGEFYVWKDAYGEWKARFVD